MNILFFVVGLCFGSFATVIINRSPTGRSQCPSCHTQLRAVELVPILSYMVLRGRCRTCRSTIGWMYPALELGSALLFLYAYSTTSTLFSAVVLALALWLLLVISAADYKTHTIDDVHSVSLLIAALAFNKITGAFDITGAILGAGFFFTLWLCSRGKWIGSGDILLAAGIGTLLASWQNMIACLLLTYIVGAAIACILLLTHKVKRGDYVAFAPFLALGTLITIIFQERIDLLIELYL